MIATPMAAAMSLLLVKPRWRLGRLPLLTLLPLFFVLFVVVSFSTAMVSYSQFEHLSYWGYVSSDVVHVIATSAGATSISVLLTGCLHAMFTTIPKVRMLALSSTAIFAGATLYTNFTVVHIATNTPAFVSIFAMFSCTVSMAYLEFVSGDFTLTIQCVLAQVPFLVASLALSGTAATNQLSATLLHSQATAKLIADAPTPQRAAAVTTMLVLLQLVRFGFGVRAGFLIHAHTSGFIRRPVALMCTMHSMMQLLPIVYILWTPTPPELGYVIASSTTYYPLLYTPSALLHILSSSHDVEKAAAATVRDARHKLKLAETATAARRQFLRWVFHESRSPFQALVYGIDDLRESSNIMQDAQSMATLGVMSVAADSMRKIMDGVLDLERIESGQFSIELSPFSVESMLESMLGPIRTNAAHMKVTLRTHIARSLPPYLLGDASRLTRVLANFCGNAMKFVPHDGTGVVDVRVRILSREEVAAAGVSTGVVRGNVLSTDPLLGAGSDSDPGSFIALSPTVSVVHHHSAGGLVSHVRIVPAASSRSSRAPSDAASNVHITDGTLTGSATVPHAVATSAWHWCCGGHASVAIADSFVSAGSRMAGTAAHTGVTSERSGAYSPRSGVSELSPTVAAARYDTPLPFAPHRDTQYSVTIDPQLYAATDDVVWLRVEVVDNGCGISAADQARLFNPFVQVSAGMLQKGKGTGLGLHISKEIVVRHGGRIGVKSNDTSGGGGVGSTFWMDVPMATCTKMHRSPAFVDADSAAWPPPPDVNADALRSISHHENARSMTTPSSHMSTAPLVSETSALLRSSVTTHGLVTSQSSGHAPAQSIPDVSPAPVTDIPSMVVSVLQFDTRHTVTEPSIVPEVVRNACILTAYAPHAMQHQGSPRQRRDAVDTDGTGGSARRPVGAAATAADNLGDTNPVVFSILIVDDTESVRVFLRRLLQRRLPHAVIRDAADGRLAMAAYYECMEAGEPIHAVLLDKEMPHMDGYDVARSLREHGFTGVIIGITGNALQRDRDEFLARGCDAVLTKPVSISHLMEVLGEHLRVRSAGAWASQHVASDGAAATPLASRGVTVTGNAGRRRPHLLSPLVKVAHTSYV